ncbi:MAG: hypothetical protein HYU34_03825 [Candidatus Omnitrophica bacterium]|nr:hypothetical protein [Candidatus Omnitrophota bacterium]
MIFLAGIFLDETGQAWKQWNLSSEPGHFTLYLKHWEGKIKATLEVICSGYRIVGLLQRWEVEVKLAHPYKTRIIGEAVMWYP